MTIRLCECGCGEEVGVAPRTIPQKGYIKGQALRFKPGHSLKIHGGRIPDANPLESKRRKKEVMARTRDERETKRREDLARLYDIAIGKGEVPL